MQILNFLFQVMSVSCKAFYIKNNFKKISFTFQFLEIPLLNFLCNNVFFTISENKCDMKYETKIKI